MKRVLSLLLVATIAISMLVVMPTTVVAAPLGTAISNDVEFAAMAAGGQYYLTADITVSATYTTEFSGTLDGNGYKITISEPLFATVSGTVKNLTVEGSVNFSTTPDNAGAVTKIANNATFANVTNRASVTGYTTTYDNGEGVRMATAGGIAGMAIGNSTFTNVANEGAINGYNTGGIVGMLSNTDGATNFSYCTNSGAITTNNTNIIGTTSNPLRFYLKSGNYLGVGGIVGLIYEQGNVSFANCSNNGSIDTTTITVVGHDPFAPAGGIYGVSTYADSLTVTPKMSVSLDNCSNTASIKGIRQTGGLVGWGATASFTVSYSSNSGTIESTTSYSGGIVGRPGQIANESNIIGCLNTGNVLSSISQVGGIVGYADTTGLKIISCINQADIFTTNSGIRGGGIIGACGSTNFSFIDCINEGDITATSTTGGIVGYTTQIGGLVKGCINKGNVEGTTSQTGGVIGYSQKSITIEYCINEAGTVIKSGTSYAGGIVGRLCQDITTTFTSAVVGNFVIRNCVNKGDVISNYTSGNGNAGGIVAYTRRNVSIYNCINYGTITSNNISGGIAGYLGSGDSYTGETIIYGCMNYGAVKSGSSTYGGGVVGYTFSTNTSNTGKYTTISYCGNVGSMEAGTISCGILGYTNAFRFTLENSFSTGTLTAPKTYGGAYNAISTANYANATQLIVSNCYFPDSDAYADSWFVNQADVARVENEIVSVGQVISGELAIKLNVDSEEFYQTLTTDTHPTTDKSHHAVRFDGTTYYNLLKATFENGHEKKYVDAALGESFTAPTGEKVLYWASGSEKVMPKAAYQMTADKTYTATTLAVETNTAAAVRMTEGSTGLRFYTNIDKSDYDAVITDLSGSTYSVSYGTIVAPAAYVTEAGAFTKEALGTLVKTSETYLQIPSIGTFATTDDSYIITGSITNLGATTGKNDHRAVDFAAIGYICITDSASGNSYYLYSNTYSTRNVSTVATSALNDVSDTQVAGYGHMVVGGTHDAKYSPYTAEQRAILESLVVADVD